MAFQFQVDLKKNLSPLSPTALNPEKLYDLLIVGGGPAGLNAALYARRKGLDIAVLTVRKGGQLLDTSSVDNYLGISLQTGEKLAEEFLQHVEALHVPILEDAEVAAYSSLDGVHYLTLLSGVTYQAKAVIIATGSKPRHLNIPGEDRFAGKGVAYCAICDAPLFKGKDVLIAGGGNSAVESALDLAKVAHQVQLIHRSQFRADKILVDKLYQEEKIAIRLETEILEVLGDSALRAVKVRDKATGKEEEITADGLFIEIGHIPNLGPFHQVLQLNAQGEILVDEKNRTNLPGVFAAGDVTQIPYKQIILAASDGAKAALAANEYLNTWKPHAAAPSTTK